MMNVREWTEYWVEFDFNESRFGNRPDQIRTFKNKEDADAFAATLEDAVVVGVQMTECEDDEDAYNPFG